MPETGKITELASAYFDLRFRDGFLVSIQSGGRVGGERGTRYILPDHAFGGALATVEAGGALHNLSCAPGEALEGAAEGGRFTARGAMGELLMLESVYEPEGDSLLWSVTLKNVSDSPLEIRDFALQFPCNSRFAWGVPAADKVIGHHFIGASGSHLIFERCDGRGPMLMLLPQDDTSLEYCDVMGVEEGKGGYTAYLHSAEKRKGAVAAGARVHIPESTARLAPGEEKRYAFRYVWALDEAQARAQLVRWGLADVRVLPGMTAPRDQEVRLCVSTRRENLSLALPEGACVLEERRNGVDHLYTLRFDRLGENTLWLVDGDWRMNLDFFITEPLETLVRKRQAFIAAHRHTDPTKWYRGLLAEWNNETGALLGPDNYDKIGGWRIYEVSCDDPGLSKPAFLAASLAERPSEDGIRAIDDYVEHFVWGGLQCTEDEPYPYAIYGIPDWKQLRDSADPDVRGRLHIWRIYDYPHLVLMYHSLYRVKKQHPDAALSRDARTYLLRAYRTAVAMFTVPLELDDWSAFGTGLYNELSIEWVLGDLEREGFVFERRRLARLWDRKAFSFAQKAADVFGSEYPFDTTGFESTHALAKRALSIAKAEVDPRDDKRVSPAAASAFMESQLRSNVACRGVLEPAYYWYGSDYRGNNTHYTLSYMSQMGGWAVLDYALRFAADPFALLRLGYGSAMSSWALLNSGDAASDYGFWFPGAAHDGAASGGFEPLFEGKTWLEQPHHGGAWYYSCEIDLGFCGYLRCARTILAEDPVFGPVCLGGSASTENGVWRIAPSDGVDRRFHYVGATDSVHVEVSMGRLRGVNLDPAAGRLELDFDFGDIDPACEAELTVTAERRKGGARETLLCEKRALHGSGTVRLEWPITNEREG